jgi:hypothetical protein
LFHEYILVMHVEFCIMGSHNQSRVSLSYENEISGFNLTYAVGFASDDELRKSEEKPERNIRIYVRTWLGDQFHKMRTE